MPADGRVADKSHPIRPHVRPAEPPAVARQIGRVEDEERAFAIGGQILECPALEEVAIEDVGEDGPGFDARHDPSATIGASSGIFARSITGLAKVSARFVARPRSSNSSFGQATASSAAAIEPPETEFGPRSRSLPSLRHREIAPKWKRVARMPPPGSRQTRSRRAERGGPPGERSSRSSSVRRSDIDCIAHLTMLPSPPVPSPRMVSVCSRRVACGTGRAGDDQRAPWVSLRRTTASTSRKVPFTADPPVQARQRRDARNRRRGERALWRDVVHRPATSSSTIVVPPLDATPPAGGSALRLSSCSARSTASRRARPGSAFSSLMDPARPVNEPAWAQILGPVRYRSP